ncbi:MAG: histidine phosphatase family protein, partial [Limnohabitans sp.]
MGQLTWVRHGQASFGAEDYDQLSDLGKRQSIRLGQCWKQASA